jgi:putative transposase
MTEHVGYERHDPAARNGENSRNGTRTKTVITEVGPVELAVPRDRDGSFDPELLRKRQRRLRGVDEMVISLTAKGLTTGEVQAHLAEVYGTDVSRGDGLQDRRSDPGGDDRVDDPPARARLARGRHRRHGGEGPRRASHQPARLHRHRCHHRWPPGDPGAVGGHRRGGRQVLIVGP